MSQYSILWVADSNNPRGYRDRQLFANRQGADVYLELHFNAKINDRPGMDDNPASVLVADNASPTSRALARSLALATAEEWNIPSVPGGVVELGGRSRGYYNLYYTSMPAVLTEMFWASEEKMVDLLEDPDEREKMARLILDCIRKHFPKGAVIALSIGHLFKGTGDKGAPAAGGDKSKWEGQLALLLGRDIERLLQKSGCRCPNCGACLTIS